MLNPNSKMGYQRSIQDSCSIQDSLGNLLSCFRYQATHHLFTHTKPKMLGTWGSVKESHVENWFENSFKFLEKHWWSSFAWTSSPFSSKVDHGKVIRFYGKIQCFWFWWSSLLLWEQKITLFQEKLLNLLGLQQLWQSRGSHKRCNNLLVL